MKTVQEIQNLRQLFEELDGAHTGRIPIAKLQVRRSLQIYEVSVQSLTV